MSKRRAPEHLVARAKTSRTDQNVTNDSSGREEVQMDEMGEFEDAWEDEIESDEEVVDAEGDDEEDGMDVDEALPTIEESKEKPPPDVYLPGTHVLGDDEVLEADDTVYIMRHSMKVSWPCLSFDVLRDSLGDGRQRFPTSMYMVAGTQADAAEKNEVVVCKLSSLHRTQKDDNDSSSDDEDDDSDVLDEDPVLEYRSIHLTGGVNRIRVQPLPPSVPLPPVTEPYYVSSWIETGKVHIFNVRPHIESIDTPGYTYDKAHSQPTFTVESHGRAEGFAMDWASSGPASLRLLTGDVHSKIYLTTSTPTGFITLSQPFLSHTSSVEDLQWSPVEPTVFTSCSADRSVQIWDVRTKGRKGVAGIESAHESDVNVISWNRSTSYLLLSGGDEGGIKTWDLRNVKKKGSGNSSPTPVAAFNWHKGPITSIEWHPTEDSIFAVSGADDQLTLWDLAVEHDTDETRVMGASVDGSPEIPPQLLFVHQGQKDIKELHWHPQVTGTIISTASDGFNIFRTISV